MGPVKRAGGTSVHSTPTRALAVAAWLFCAFFAVNLVLTGTPASIWHFLPELLFIAWGVYVLLWRPCLRVDDGGVTVVNIVREHRVPFAALKAVRVGQNVVLETTAGRIGCWGAPGAGKLGPRRGTAGSGTAGMGKAGTGTTSPQQPRTKAAVEASWEAWERDRADAAQAARPASDMEQHDLEQKMEQQKVRVHANVPVAVVGAVLLALAVASVLS